MHVLFICTGNICRSPTAERLAAAYGSSQFNIPNLATSSAGTRAVIGQPIHQQAAAILERLGAATSHFAARQLTAKIANNADLLIAMTKEHRDSVLELAPRQFQRTFTLVEAATLAGDFDARTIGDLPRFRPRLTLNALTDIPDPIGEGPEVFEEVGSRIAELLQPILELCSRSAST